MLFCVLVLVRVENRKILPDNFVRAIPLDAFGSRIPCPDIAISIKHVNRIVGYGLDEHIQLVFSVRNFLRHRFVSIGHANTSILRRADIAAPLPEKIEQLFDSRILRILRKNVSSHDQPGVRYDVYKIDYGCYVEFTNTAKEPQGLFQLEESDEYVEVPIRRAILRLDPIAEEDG